METPSFTFRLERLCDLRERSEEAAREELAREPQLRMRGLALLQRATQTATDARDACRGALGRFGGGSPYAETQEYVRRVRANAAEYRAAAATATTAVLSASPSVHGIV